jgi:hypothetical protein
MQSLCRDGVGADALLPTQHEGVIKDAVGPCGGKIIEVGMIGDWANIIMLDECPIAAGVQKQEPLATSIFDVKNEGGCW